MDAVYTENGMSDVAKTSLRLPKDLMKQMKQVALDTDKSITECMIEAMQDYIKKKSK